MKNLSTGIKRHFKLSRIVLALWAGIGLGIGGCASTNDNPAAQTDVNERDPYENFNRKIYGFNNSVDDYVAKPISDAYQYITPEFVQTGVSNFFTNLKNINVVLNDLLQAKFSQGAADTGRFAVNSTFGLLGLFDVATELGLDQHEEDFDQTLAVWGVSPGSYLVLPLLGPSTTRGIPGAIFDTAANPSSYVGAPVQLVSLLNTRANAEGSLKFIDEAALDPYIFTREAFLQWRKNLALDGKSDQSIDNDLDSLLEDDAGDSKPKGHLSLASPQTDEAGKEGAIAATNSGSSQFDEASKAFEGAAESFDSTAKTFEEANQKLDKVKKRKK